MKTSPVVIGTVYCVFAALGYTVTNSFLRYLAALGIDQMWVVCIKEVVTVCIVGPWLLVQYFRRVHPLLRARVVVVLMLIGLAVQLYGNLNMQWAFGIVGLAVSMPAAFGAMIVGSAVLGWFLLGEAVGWRTIVAIVAVIGAIVILSMGASSGRQSLRESAAAQRSLGTRGAFSHVVPEGPSLTGGQAAVPGVGWLRLDRSKSVSEHLVAVLGEPALAVAAACLAGFVYAVLGVGTRWATRHQTPVSVIVFIVTGMGVLSLGSLSVVRVGIRQLLATDPFHLGLMLSAGLANLLGFLAITKGLQLVPVAHANVVNASQVALGAVLGVVLFGELRGLWLVPGVGLTVVGILLVGSENASEGRKPEHRSPTS